ncbi:P-loop containing nucleoside triphosphate hydrolase protein [Peziza echinospora]|nr:P-loop containing nucleoside triphosphate hydrolase protein [Peziza echinospora]
MKEAERQEEVQAEVDSAQHERMMLKSVVGAGLKRPLDLGEDGRPILKKLKRARNMEPRSVPKAPSKFSMKQPGQSDEEDSDEEMLTDEEEEEEEEDPEEWNGFADSDNGSAKEETESESESGSEDGEEEEEGVKVDAESESEDEGESGDDDDSEGDEEDSDDEDDDGESGSSDEDGSDSSEAPIPRMKKGTSEKASAFKSWALSQRLAVLNGGVLPTEETTTTMFPAIPKGYVPKPRVEESPPPPELMISTTNADRKSFYVAVERPMEIQVARLALPVVGEEQKIMEAIHANSCVVICGETGSGKTTQVPQFLYESGYGHKGSPNPGLIGVTQPRRVAAVSMAKRVGDELGDNDLVSYSIRFEGTVGPKTAIKFMTDGVLLRELSTDFLLQKYSAIVIDEAHERGINTDILIGVMSRVIKLREEMHKENPDIKPLKLIIMSATLRVSDFTENKALFSTPPPLLKAEARQFPVSNHFSRKTPRDYVDEAYRKICKIHRRLPAGGILVFLTGQNEIQYLLKKLRKTFPNDFGAKELEAQEAEPSVKISAKEAVVEDEDVELTSSNTDDSAHKPLDEDALEFPDSDGSDSEEEGFGKDEDGNAESAAASDTPLHILPLYSLLPTAQQLRIFDPPPTGHRLCVLATNIAETSLTIPNIRYVVDTGRAKQRNYDKVTGVQSYDIGWVSKASASQRSGRSGRTGPGHCYRLYSSAVYERDFEEFGEAEVKRMPIEGVVLQMKAMGIDVIENFPFPTPPERESLRRAEMVLGYLGAVETKLGGNGAGSGALTELGRTMSLFPLPPRFAKILIIGQQHGCLPYVIAIVAALSVGEIFIPEHQLGIEEDSEDEDDKHHNEPAPDYQSSLLNTRKSAKLKAYRLAQKQFSASLDATSDVLRDLAVVCAFEWEAGSVSAEEAFCERNFVRLKAMTEIRRLRRQIGEILKSWSPGIIVTGKTPGPGGLKLTPPTPLQVRALKQIVAAGFIDNIAIRTDLLPKSDALQTSRKPRKMAEVEYTPLFPPTNLNIPSTITPRGRDLLNATGVVTIHPASTLAALPITQAPPYIIYSALTLTTSSTAERVRIRMTPLSPVPMKQIAQLAKGTRLLAYGKPLAHIPPKALERDEGGRERKECWVVPRLGGWGRPDAGWELAPEKVVMRKVGGTWVVE